LLNVLRCPSDGGIITKEDKEDDAFFCRSCNVQYPMVEVSAGRPVLDLRCADRKKRVKIEFDIPVSALKTEKISSFSKILKLSDKSMSRKSIKKTFGTKLSNEIMYYARKEYALKGPDALVLDLGCGSGGNKKYLESIGFRNVIAVDYWSSGAEYLVDAHRLPFEDTCFDMILTTATLEHLYNPFVAISEIRRVLKPGGTLLATASFWESWHGHSCFHFTPDGLHALCCSADLVLEDIWPQAGFIPSIAYHAFNVDRFRPVMYKLQSLFNWTKRWTRGKTALFYHRLRTSGSFGFCARRSCSDG